jgi:hypothetical protein
MNLAVLLLMSAVSAPPNAASEHKRYIALHHDWQRIHETATRERTPANACLVLDPRVGAVWIEKDGKTDSRDVQALPSGLDWSAYLVTPQGVTEIPFPVRLNRPDADVRNDDDTEQIWVVGSGKDESWQFSVSASPVGHAFHVGSGSPISSITVTVPHLNAATRNEPPRESILVSGRPQRRKWADVVRNEWFSVNVVRSAAVP